MKKTRPLLPKSHRGAFPQCVSRPPNKIGALVPTESLHMTKSSLSLYFHQDSKIGLTVLELRVTWKLIFNNPWKKFVALIFLSNVALWFSDLILCLRSQADSYQEITRDHCICFQMESHLFFWFWEMAKIQPFKGLTCPQWVTSEEINSGRKTYSQQFPWQFFIIKWLFKAIWLKC